MAKKYRLKKDLPDCKKGDIVTFNEHTQLYHYGETIGLHINNKEAVIHKGYYKEEVENNSTWFEEIKEPEHTQEFVWTDELVHEITHYISLNISEGLSKTSEIKDSIQRFKEHKASPDESKVDGMDWEILSFRCTMPGSDDIYNNRNSDGTFGIMNCEEKDFLESSIHVIHSVKRQDGEVFTIGDLLIGLGKWSNEAHKITSIYPINGTIALGYGETGAIIISHAKKSTQTTQQPEPHKCKYCGIMTTFPDEECLKNPNKWQTEKPVLFVTEDGVEIREGDKFVAVQNRTFHILGIPCSYPLSNPGNWKTFSTQEKANEYVLMNKPCLSVNDILLIANYQTNFRIELSKKELEQLAKSKQIT